MYFDTWQALRAMDGHGPYVWSAYAITLVVLLWLLLAPLHRRRRLMADIHAQERRRAASPDFKTGVD